MALTPERRAQMDAALRGGQTAGKLSPERRAQMDAALMGSAPVQQPAPQQPGFLASLAAPFTKTLATGLGAVESVGRLGIGALTGGGLSPEEMKASQNAATRERNFGVFGKATPIGADISATEGVGSALGKFAKPVIETGAQLASFAAPVTGVARTAGLLPKVLSGMKLGGLSTGIAGAASESAKPGSTFSDVIGGGLKSAVGGAALGGLFPLAGGIASGVGKATGAGLGVVGKAIGGKGKSDVSSRLVNSIIKPLEKEFRFGRDPGSTVVDEMIFSGVTPNSRDGMAEFISSRVTARGEEIGKVLTSPIAATKRIDIRPAVNKLDALMDDAAKSGEGALLNRLQEVKDGLEYTFARKGGGLVKSQPKEFMLSPKEAQELKTFIGKKMRWTGQAFDNDVNQARAAVYRELDRMIDTAVPEVKKLNEVYGGLLSAERSLERTANVGQRGQILSMGDLVTGGLGGAVLGGPAAIASVAGRRFIESTPFKARVAVILRKHGISKSFEELLAMPVTELDETIKKLPVAERLKLRTIMDAAQKGLRAATATQATSGDPR